jgi:methyltransferase-like protein
MDKINIRGQILGIQLSLSQSQYKLIMSTVEENFSEKITFETLATKKKESKGIEVANQPSKAGIATCIEIGIDGSAIIYETTSEGYDL